MKAKTYLVIILLAGSLNTYADLSEVQRLTAELQRIDQSIDNLENQIGQSIVANSGPTPAFDQMTREIQKLEENKRTIYEQIQRLGEGDGNGYVQPNPVLQPSQPDFPGQPTMPIDEECDPNVPSFCGLNRGDSGGN